MGVGKSNILSSSPYFGDVQHVSRAKLGTVGTQDTVVTGQVRIVATVMTGAPSTMTDLGPVFTTGTQQPPQ